MKPQPKEPTNERYMVGWFLVEMKDQKRARLAAREYVKQLRRDARDLL